jgi:hypothetical protein
VRKSEFHRNVYLGGAVAVAKKKNGQQRGTVPSSRAVYHPNAGFPYRRILPVAAVVAAVLIVIGIGSSVNRTPAPSPTGAPPTVARTAAPTATVDPCATELIRPDIEKVDALMQEFYDASALAAQTPANRLLEVIPSLQEIRRRAQALKVSHCLDTLRSYQISHMNMVINTMISFMGNADQSVLMEGIVQARLLNEAYKKEKARLLGEPYIPPATATPMPTQGTMTPQPSKTP